MSGDPTVKGWHFAVRISEVDKQAFEKRYAALIPIALLDRLDPAELETRRSSCFFRRQPCPDVVSVCISMCSSSSSVRSGSRLWPYSAPWNRLRKRIIRFTDVLPSFEKIA